MALDALLSSLDADSALPPVQGLANAAIVVVFAYLVPLLTMEINFFRLAVYRSWRRAERRANAAEVATDAAAIGGAEPTRSKSKAAGVEAGAGGGERSEEGWEEQGGEEKKEGESPHNQDDSNRDQGALKNKIPMVKSHSHASSSGSSSAVGHLLNDITAALHDTVHNPDLNYPDSPSLQKAYKSIRSASLYAIVSSLMVYSITALAIALNTRGLDEKVIAIVVGASQFMASLMVFIVSAKVPQWIGVYHQGAIRLVKCSSNYSQSFEDIDLDDEADLKRLRGKVQLGVWFHFSKFYIVLMPFYCGVQEVTIPLSIVAGAVLGFILMWAVFVVHEKYIHHRNAVSFTTILLLSIISALTFVRGMAWIQVVWKLDVLNDEDTLIVISFFAWLGLQVIVHALFIWHTVRTEVRNSRMEAKKECDGEALADSGHGSSGRSTPKLGKSKQMKRSNSYSSFHFDPRTHFTDGKCQFSEHPDLEDDFTNESTDAALSDDRPIPSLAVIQSIDACGDGEGDLGLCIETTMEGTNPPGKAISLEFGEDELDNDELNKINSRDGPGEDAPKKKTCPSCCEVFVCFSPEYQQSSCFWKAVCWIKIIVLTIAYLLCLYFVIVSIGATHQINSVKRNLPAVHEALYNHMNEGPVCAFDNRGPESTITTFEGKEAAHDAGFLIVHCGACGACSTWENLIIEWTTRNTMAAAANECAKKSLFGGGDDALTECIMEPPIGFGYECAVCWQKDILCTKDHCAFIFLQSQLINNVGNFAVGKDEITSANCEEAHCEVGQFVPCSGATRRRMNIVSSISRPGDQQCEIVDVESWEDLFFGSGVA